ncbi:hypothetical protein GC089_16185 [Cellulomonas sp. JZ18]|uniref:hypothetical protein n=1 Tax=Cellulomonas sp. JZ18 TaxID=2654191 RepID=UPI0012D3AF23|nr:hypothetical protein [Cellulomonas sp. JZ18]QGQ20447.1 hypothetical protein GC089_16185 [Cellulomonas sp. JZ18]
MTARGRGTPARVLTAAALAVTAGLAAAPPATAAPPVYRCSEQADWPIVTDSGRRVLDGDLLGDLRVCDVSGVHVLGDVRVEPGTHTNLFRSLVDGVVASAGAVDLIQTTVRDDVHLTGGAGLATANAHLEGSVRARGSVILDQTVVRGDVVVETSVQQPWLRVVDSTVSGDLAAHGGDMTFAWTTVEGDMDVARWTNLRVCGGGVGGDVLLAAAAGTGALGASSCGGQGPRIGGSLTAVDVQPSLSVLRTSVGEDLRCLAAPGLLQLFGVSVGGYRDPGCRSR